MTVYIVHKSKVDGSGMVVAILLQAKFIGIRFASTVPTRASWQIGKNPAYA